MKKIIPSVPRFAAAFIAAAFLFTLTAAAQSVTFKVDADAAVASTAEPLSGRLLIFMKKDDGKPTDGFGTDLSDPNLVFVSGTEVSNLVPGKPVEIDADANAFPAAFSTAPAGAYEVFALLDRDHSYTYAGPGGGDVYGAVVKLKLPGSGAPSPANVT